jgi:flavin-dependent dehydrogenase
MNARVCTAVLEGVFLKARKDINRRRQPTVFMCVAHEYIPLPTPKMAKEQDCHTLARLLPTSLAFYCWALHAKTNIARNGAGSPAYAP